MSKGSERFLEQAQDLSLSGFSIVCSWHFLAIFTAIPLLYHEAGVGRPVYCQALLCLAVAFGYLVSALIGGRLDERLHMLPKRKRNMFDVFAALYSCAASVLFVAAPYLLPDLQVVSFAILGTAEAPIMLPWLRLAQVNTKRHKSRYALAINMGAGAVIAFVIASLQVPFAYVVFCALPLVSQASFVSYARYIEGAVPETPAKQAALSFRLLEVLENNLHFVIFGFAFGAVQVALSASTPGSGLLDFAVNGAWPLCGAIASAAIIVAIPHGMLKTRGIFIAQRFSIILFAAGCLLQLYFSVSALPSGAAGTLSQALVLAGFNVFDFGFMVYSLAWATQLKSGYTRYIGLNRAILYLSTALGILAGSGAQLALSDVPNADMIVCSCAVVLLLFTILPVFEEFAPYGTPLELGETALEPTSMPGAAPLPPRPAAQRELDPARVEEQATAHGLSKREREILGYLAQGRNAAYIQQELWISIYTVKTHISNIYRKFDVHSQQQLLDMLAGQEEDAQRTSAEHDDSKEEKGTRRQ